MPTDQSLGISSEPGSGHDGAAWTLFAVAVACFVGAAFVISVPTRFGLLIGGGVLLVLTALRVSQRRLQKRHDIGLAAVATTLIAQDADCAFITTSDYVVICDNPVAVRRFGETTNLPMKTVLGMVMANPDALFDRLHARLENQGFSKEDIITRNSHFRLSVSQITQDQVLWRLDDLAETTHAALNGGSSKDVVRLIADADGIITDINGAASTLLGRQPASLGDVVVDAALTPGKIHRVSSANGPVNMFVAQFQQVGGDTENYLFPVDGVGRPKKFNAGWDAIEDLPVPLMKISPDGEVLASNKEARILLRIDDMEGKQVGDLLDGLGRPINDWLREAAEGRGGHVSQFLRGRGANQDTFVQVTLNIAGDHSDMQLIAVLNDVTELKTLEAQFVQSQKMQAIGQLAGGVAHDFNNLLTAISGHCDLLLLRHDEGDQNYGDLIQIHQNANRAASLVGQLLAYSRKQNLQPEIIDLRDTLSDLTHLLNRLVGEKVTLTLNHDPALAQIKADKRQLEQVLMNLVVNARDAMPGGGEIKVLTENLNLKVEMAKDRAVVPPGEYVMVKVMDEGHGIPPEKLPKIFEPFWTTKRTGEGTGLGLSTAYGIVKQTGGYIFAESEVDAGTHFSLLFPSYDLPVAEPLAVAASGPAPISSEAEGVVLLVEDEAPVRAFASRALRLRGYTVLEADCAEAALDLLSDPALGVDIFVTDVIMPGKDGPTWVREALLERPDTKVVFVSGYAEDAFGDEKSRIPNSVFLPKPFSLNALTQTVQGQLQDQRLTA